MSFLKLLVCIFAAEQFLSSVAVSQDYVVVTAERAYPVNSAGQSVEPVETYDIFSVVEERGDFYQIRTASGATLRLRREFTHSLVKHWDVKPDEIQDLRKIFELTKRAEAADAKSRGALFRDAVQMIDRRLNSNIPLKAWLQTLQAYHQSEDGDPAGGLKVIRDVRKRLAETGHRTHVVMAEVANVEGLILQTLGSQKDADAAMKEAIQIAQEQLGGNHNDVAVYLRNRSFGRSAAEKYGKAVRDAQAAHEIEQEIYPPNAIELPRGLILLGQALVENDEAISATRMLMPAMGQLRTHHPQKTVDLADCQLSLAEAWYNRDEQLQAERTCSNIDFRLPVGADDADAADMLSLHKSTLHLLGDIDFDRKQFTAALDHYMAAAELIDDDNMESLDGWSYVYAADALDALGRRDKAQRIYKGAWLIFEKTDGPKSQNALEARQMFVDAGGVLTAGKEPEKTSPQMNNAANEKSDPSPGLDTTASVKSPTSSADESNTYAMILRDGEAMYTTTASASIKIGTEVLATVPAGTRLWSLEQRDDWHRVIVPGTSKKAWINNSSVVSEHVTNAQSMSRMINERAGNKTAAGDLNKKLLTLLPKVAEVSSKQGIAAAVPLQEEVVELLEEAAGPENFMTLTVKSRLATYYSMNRQFVRARGLIEEAIPAMRVALGDDHPGLARELTRLASLLSMIGDANSQKDCLEEALQIATRHLGPDDLRVTGLRLNLASVLRSVGQFKRADELYQQVIRVANTRDPVDTRAIAFARAGLGTLRLAEYRLDEAITLMNQACADCEALGESMRVTHGAALFSWAMALTFKNELTEGAEILEQAEEKLKVDGKLSPALELHILSLQSGISAKLGEWEKTLSLSDSALQKTQALYGKTSYLIAGPLSRQAQAQTKLGRQDEARALFERARRITHNYITQTIANLNVSSQIDFLKSNDNALLQVALSHAVPESADHATVEASVTWLLNAKNLANELAAKDGQTRRLLTSDRHLTAYETWLDTRRRIANLPPLTEEESADQQLKQTEQELRRTGDAAFDQLPAEAREFLERKQTSWITCDDVRNRLDGDQVFIDFVRMRRRADSAKSADNPRPGVEREEYVAWIIPASGSGDVKVVSLGVADEIDTAAVQPYLKKVMNAVSILADQGEVGALADLADINRELNKQLWLPLSNHIPDGTKKLILCPDSALWQVPWAAIENDDRKLLLEDFAIRYVSSGRDLLLKKANVADLSAPVILADPEYAATAESIQKSIERLPLRSLRLSPRNLDASLLREILPEQISRLPATAAEAAAVQPLIEVQSGMQSEVFLRDAASETIFRMTERPHTLFVGTHGFFLPESDLPERDSILDLTSKTTLGNDRDAELNPLRRCGLLLAGCSDATLATSEDQLDGILTGAEIVTQDLRGTQLVVLSACETGVGDLSSGQGVQGLRQAIQLAGAETVVSTLWQIPDRETQLLMTLFFENLAAGKSRSEALRQAQLSRIRKRRDRNGAAHPLFWAAFTLTGQD